MTPKPDRRRRIDLDSQAGQKCLREAGLAAVQWYEDTGDDCHLCRLRADGMHDDECPLEPLYHDPQT